MPPRFGAFLAIVFWGISFVATKAALTEVSPVTLVFTRFALGTGLLLALLAARSGFVGPGFLGIPRDALGVVALMGFVGVFVHMLLQSYALTLTTAVRTGWLIGLIPIWSALLAAIFLGERFGRLKVAGLALGFAGAVLVVTRGQLGPEVLALPQTWGDFLILVSTVNWAVYTAFGHRTIARLGSLRATAGAMLAGWLMLVPLFVASAGWREYGALSLDTWGAILFLGIACSGLGYYFWYAALERIETSQVAAFLYLEPLVTLGAAMVLLGERAGATTIVGGLLIFAGVALVQKAPGGQRARPERPES